MPADRGDFLFTVPARMNQEYKTLSSKKPRKLFSYPKPIKDIKPSSGLRHNSELQKTNREKLLGGMVGRGEAGMVAMVGGSTYQRKSNPLWFY